MEVVITKLTDLPLAINACEMTRHIGQKTTAMTLAKLYRCEHSPIRTQLFWIELREIPTFVSVHLVRHKIGVEHYVESNRDDRGGSETVTRDTPVNHGMLINAQAIIAISQKRLCYAAHRKTVAVWTRIKKEMKQIDPDLSAAMVPACVYRGGICPELKECKVGLSKVMKAYGRTFL